MVLEGSVARVGHIEPLQGQTIPDQIKHPPTQFMRE
jgi:hypothetical protein